ncbi:hypothetical protein B0T19DRAFT_480317, partial [Cercophora scortea]
MGLKRAKLLAVLKAAITACGHLLPAEAVAGAAFASDGRDQLPKDKQSVTASLNKIQATAVKVPVVEAKILQNKSEKGETSMAPPVIPMIETPAPIANIFEDKVEVRSRSSSISSTSTCNTSVFTTSHGTVSNRSSSTSLTSMSTVNINTSVEASEPAGLDFRSPPISSTKDMGTQTPIWPDTVKSPTS